MTLHWLDWIIVGAFLLTLISIAIYTKRYMRGVSGFLVADRCASRYLLGVSRAASSFGAISIIALFQMYYNSGFGASWWAILITPIGLMIAVSGYISYRLRETRAMTLSQLFEIRYGRKFRIFCGLLIWVTGMANMGIFPAVFAKFIIYYCGFAPYYFIFGFKISTFVLVMLSELIIALSMVLFGGLVVVMVTDFFEAMFCNIAMLIIAIFLFTAFDWSQISSVLSNVSVNASKINPYKMINNEGFNVFYFLMSAFILVYSCSAWQGGGGYGGAAKNAHEAKMSSILGTWRDLPRTLMVMLLAICALTVMQHADFGSSAAAVNAKLELIDNDAIRKQVVVPLALSQIFPMGVIGLFLCIIIAAAIASDGSYLHSWGSIFIQDVVLPFRKKELTPRQHINLLRFSIVLVAAVIFCFSILFKQNDFIMMYLQLTGAIYLGGAGSVLIGGLYWKHGSTIGAWAAMIVGAIMALSGLVLRSVWSAFQPILLENFQWQWLENSQSEFPLNGIQISVIAMVSAIVVYIIGSLISWLVLKKPAFNIDKMLHRGIYAVKGDHIGGVVLPQTGLKALLTTKEFNFRDKCFYYASILWTLMWFLFFVIVTIYHYVFGTTDTWWNGYWKFFILFNAIIGLLVIFWFLIGGLFDLRELFHLLKIRKIDVNDDGRVPSNTMITSKDKNGIVN